METDIAANADGPGLAPAVREIRFSRIVDLSISIGPQMQMFPTYPPPAFTQWTTRDAQGFLAESVFLVSHTGTHVDAPWHFEPSGRKLDAVPLERFAVLGHLLDFGSLRAGERITRAKLLQAWKRRSRRITSGDAILLRTGWERMRGRPSFLFRNPGLSREAAQEIVRWRPAWVGVDTANIDHPEDGTYPAHHTLLGAGIPIVENATNLRALGDRPFFVLALPLKLEGTTGSPIRLAALVD